eukprot:gnl/TRDRNA2_/TRDRNA2_163422_c1_seq1.p1 gnl/TRDRNA2_/TRDRNA2_163422_c1~~gnl/TRDRNA2_/TRDRNA2_163422_c1_seq1.p1  ORF type:complete len:240 (+),score=25.57 gnl/TRDRNA2_/TRDRNA2_163422_c1_seq1:32-751(+)
MEEPAGCRPGRGGRSRGRGGFAHLESSDSPMTTGLRSRGRGRGGYHTLPASEDSPFSDDSSAGRGRGRGRCVGDGASGTSRTCRGRGRGAGQDVHEKEPSGASAGVSSMAAPQCAEVADSVICWVSWQLLYQERPVSHEPGRLFFGLPVHGLEQRLCEMLQPITHFNQDDDSVRSAFLHVARAAVRRVGYQGTVDCSGRLRMFVSHIPSISSVAVMCQFIRFFPGMRLEVEFDNKWLAK